MYDELVNALRNNAYHYAFTGYNGLTHLLTNAADAIEELSLTADSYKRSMEAWADIAANAQPKWFSVSENPPGDLHPRCSVCGELNPTEESTCPNCGADMRGESDV